MKVKTSLSTMFCAVVASLAFAGTSQAAKIGFQCRPSHCKDGIKTAQT